MYNGYILVDAMHTLKPVVYPSSFPSCVTKEILKLLAIHMITINYIVTGA